MKHCAICGQPVESGLVVHPECCPHWRDVRKELPKVWTRTLRNGRTVEIKFLVQCQGYEMARAVFFNGTRFCTAGHVLRWMPMPEVPEEGTE